MAEADDCRTGKSEVASIPMNDRAKQLRNTEEQPFSPAFFEGKEAWKNQPGNRYTAEELRAMGRDLKLTMRPARKRTVRKA